MIDFGLAGKVVVVTGGASGIGRTLALSLASQGASVAIVDQHQDPIDEAVRETRALGVPAFGVVADVRDEAAVSRAARATEDALGRAFGLAACAGIGAAGRADSVSAAAFSEVMDVNGLGLFLTCREWGGQMIAAGDGAIVAVSSLFGLVGHTGRVGYVASKFAVNGIVKTLAVEWGHLGVRVNAVAPSLVDTPMLAEGIPEAFRQLQIERTPLARIAQPRDVANVIMMLMSDAAAYVTGTVTPVDGGLSAGLLTSESGRAIHSRRTQS